MGARSGILNYGTLDTLRWVVFAVHTVAAALRLDDIDALLDNDSRIGLVYTPVPDRFGDGVDDILRKWKVKRVAWTEATNINPPYDLAIGASLHQLGALPAARRFATPHGAGYNKRWPSWAWSGPDETRPTYGLDSDSLLDDEGRPIVDALNLSHHDQMRTLARQCPQAVDAAVIGGDPALDRLLISAAHREHYRDALNVRDGQTLVAVTSTWGRASLLRRHPELLLRLMDELPATHRVILTMHPAVWAEHGQQQIRAFLGQARSRGLGVLDAGEDWRGLLVAADILIGDHSSCSVYGAASGLPFLLSHFAEDEIDPDSVMAALARHSPQVDDNTLLLEQLDNAREARPDQQKATRERVSSVPGRSAEILRQTLYQLLELDEPRDPPRVERVPPPRLVGSESERW